MCTKVFIIDLNVYDICFNVFQSWLQISSNFNQFYQWLKSTYDSIKNSKSYLRSCLASKQVCSTSLSPQGYRSACSKIILSFSYFKYEFSITFPPFPLFLTIVSLRPDLFQHSFFCQSDFMIFSLRPKSSDLRLLFFWHLKQSCLCFLGRNCPSKWLSRSRSYFTEHNLCI